MNCKKQTRSSFQDVCEDVRLKSSKEILVGGATISHDSFTVIAGPCAIEHRDQLFSTVEKIADNVDVLRGGAWKPRSNPDSFQGTFEQGLQWLREAGDAYNLPIITEVMDPRDVGIISDLADIIQIGSKGMLQQYLLEEVGKQEKPVLLKRNHSAMLEDWVNAARYIMKEGNRDVILCERGIRTFMDQTRYTLDLAGAKKTQQKTEMLTIVDPSHATGDPDLIKPMALASQAAGLDGVMVEVHCNPDEALCDGDQSLTPQRFNEMIQIIRPQKVQKNNHPPATGWALE